MTEGSRSQAAFLLALSAGVVLALRETPPTLPILALGLLHGGVAVWAARWLPLLLCADVALVAWHATAFAPFLFASQYDTWMHLGVVRRVMEHGPFPPDPFSRGFGAAPLVSIVHHLYALATFASGLTPPELWRWGPALGLAALGGASWWMHRVLLLDARAAVFASLFHLAWIRFSWHYATYPRALAPVFTLASLALLWRAFRGGGRGAAVGAGAALGLAFATHPVTGAMSALAVGGVLAVEWAMRAREGRGRDFSRVPLFVVVAAVFAASPFLVADVLAWNARLDLVPSIWGDPAPLSDFVAVEVSRLTSLPWFEARYGGWQWLWIAPVGVGLAALLLRRAPDRLLAVYAGATSLVVFAVVFSPLTPVFEELFAPRYVARFLGLLPLPALAGFGLSLVATSTGHPAARAAGALVIALAVAGLLRGVEPWRPNEVSARALALDRPALTRLEPLLRDRVVLADAPTAYVLPTYTGAYVAWNLVEHSNPWLHDADRGRGARALLAGRWSAARARAWLDRYDVDFALLPANAPSIARERLVDTGAFRVRESGEEYVLLERVGSAP